MGGASNTTHPYTNNHNNKWKGRAESTNYHDKYTITTQTKIETHAETTLYATTMARMHKATASLTHHTAATKRKKIAMP
jgi:hypothetical protein